MFFSLVLKNLLRRKIRSLLTILGIAVGITAVTSLVALSEGFVTSFESLFKSRQTDIAVMVKNKPDLFSSIMEEDIAPQVAKLPGVKSASPVLLDFTWVDDRPNVVIYGFVLSDYVMDHIKILQGKTLSGPGKNEIVAGKLLMESMNRKVGDHVTIEQEVFEIVGEYESNNIYENGGMVTSLQTLQALTQSQGKISSVNVKLFDPMQTDKVKKEIEAMFPRLAAMAVQDMQENNQGLQMARGMAWGTSFIALLVGAIGTMNTMIMSVFERTREIGILRAVGWRKSRVLRMILLESLMLSILGGVIGIGAGYLVSSIVGNLQILKGMVFFHFSGILLLKAMGISLGLGLFGGIYPALKGANLMPMEALRYE